MHLLVVCVRPTSPAAFLWQRIDRTGLRRQTLCRRATGLWRPRSCPPMGTIRQPCCSKFDV